MIEEHSADRCRAAIHRLVASIDPLCPEEQGGFILRKGDEFISVRVRNANTGTPTAIALYTADREDFGKKVIEPFVLHGWNLFASFHTHPKGCSTWPSSIDLGQLFKGFKVNFIYSPSMFELSGYVLHEGEWQWLGFSRADLEDQNDFFNRIGDYGK